MGPADVATSSSRTRYIAYDTRLGGRYRYYRDPAVLSSPLGTRYVGDMDRLFDTYAELVPALAGLLPRAASPRTPATPTSSTARRSGPRPSTRVRGVLPAASLSNVGIYGTGQAYEALLLRMRAHPLPEARAYADLMLHELRKVIPSASSSGSTSPTGAVAWSDYLAADPHGHGGGRRAGCSRPTRTPSRRARRSRWSTATPTARSSWSPRMLYPHTHLPEQQIERPGAARMSADERLARPAGLRGGADATAATSRAGPSSASTTASTSWPTTAPSATSSATACSPSSGSR